ncbi:MAG: EamA family transporter, partial [Myxococcota bacterium]
MTEKPSGFDLRSRLDIALAAVLFSTGGAAIKLSTLSGWQVAGARSLIAALVLSLLAPRALTGWSWRILVVAGFHASTLTVFTLATKLTTAANAIFLQSTAPLYVVGLAPLMLKERFRGSDVAVAGAFLIGLV